VLRAGQPGHCRRLGRRGHRPILPCLSADRVHRHRSPVL